MNPDYARYDVSDLDAAALTMLGGLLEQRRVPHAIDLGVLLVFATDERTVDDVIAEVEQSACCRC